MKAIKNGFFMDSNFKERSLQDMTIAVKKMNNYLFPIYVHVLKERCKQLAQYLTKVQLMTNVAWVHWQRTIKILLKTTSIQKLHANNDKRTDRQWQKHYAPDIQIVGWGIKVKPYIRSSRKLIRTQRLKRLESYNYNLHTRLNTQIKFIFDLTLSYI